MKKAGVIEISTLVAVILITSLGFFRGLFDGFDLAKATFMWMCLPLLVSLGVVRSLISGVRKTWPFLLFIVAALTTTATSMRPAASLFGQYQRYSGLLTLLAVAACGIIASHIPREVDLQKVSVSFGVAGFLCSSYGLIQTVGIDPFLWTTEGVNRAVFGTLGNPNTSSGFVAVSSTFILWCALRFRANRPLVLACSAALGSSAAVLGVFASFQGTVALLPLSVWLLVLAATQPFVWQHVLGFLGLAGTCLTSSLLVETGKGVLVAVVICSTFGLLLSHASASGAGKTSLWRSACASSRRRIGSLVAMISALLAAILIVGPRLSREFAGGFAERGDFYRTVWKIFTKFPLSGTGLDTFGFVFAEYRPQGHAINLENNRTSSAHSIPLGMFANGGLLLGLSFAVLLTFVATCAVRTLRRPGTDRVSCYKAVAIAWFASVIQISVSVEHVALFTQFFILSGMVIATRHVSSSGGQESAERRPMKALLRRQIVPWATAFGVVSSLLLAPYTTKAARADNASLWSMRYSFTPDKTQESLVAAERSMALAPWEVVHLTRSIQVYQNSGNSTRALELAKIAVPKSNFNPNISVELVYLIASSGDFDLAANFAEVVATKDPFSRTVRFACADLLRQMADNLKTSGDVVRSDAMYLRAQRILPSILDQESS